MVGTSAISRMATVAIVVGLILVVAVGGGLYYVSLTTVPTAPKAAVIKIALIMEGPQQDKSWNQFHAETLQALVAESGGTLEAEYSDNVGAADFGRVSEGFANRGFSLIIGDSNNHQPPALEVARRFPDVNFAVFGAFEFLPNFVGYTTWAHEGAYLAGYLGGLMTKTNKLGVVLAFKFASQLVYWNGFLAGANRAAGERNVTISVTPAWTATWSDPAKGFEAAMAMFDAGVDFVAHDASGPGAGALQAAKQRNVPAVGAFVDESYVGPNVVTSVLFRFDGPIKAMLRDIRDGTFGGRSYDFTMKDGAIDIAPLSSSVPSDVAQKVLDLKQKILQGLVRVPFVPDRELSLTMGPIFPPLMIGVVVAPPRFVK